MALEFEEEITLEMIQKYFIDVIIDIVYI